LIRTENLSVAVKKENILYKILNNINVNLVQEGITVITGKSGIGKTVFAKTISGLLPNNFVINGLFYVNDIKTEYEDIKKMIGKGVFYLPQNAKASLNPVLKIKTQFNDFDNINKDEITPIMRDLAIEKPKKILNAYPFELSEGECQRIIFIMGMILAPKLFILDEPSSALDEKTQKIIMEKLININLNNKTSILLISHNIKFISLLQNTAYSRVSFS
jgi:ABC-type dipeptide/oligopeptide/nickel transport system ATPase component